MKIFFYPHSNLRDQQLDTIRLWPRGDVINPDMAEQKPWHYSKQRVFQKQSSRGWHQYIPAINIKLRPKEAPDDAIVYCYGGFISHGKFIVEVETPYCLTGYNLWAFRLYRPILRKLLLSPHCVQIRCISRACHDTLRIELGEKVGAKAKVYYPLLTDIDRAHIPAKPNHPLRILFISTRFEAKGGASVLRVSERLVAAGVFHQLTLVTYLPDEYLPVVAGMPHVNYIQANLNRNRLIELYKTHDVFFFPTYHDSFGMVVWEALAHGMAIVANDVYAIREMVLPGYNGYLVTPPIANWCSVMPTKYNFDDGLRKDLTKLRLEGYENQHFLALKDIANDSEKLLRYKQFSQQHFQILSDQPHYFSIPD